LVSRNSDVAGPAKSLCDTLADVYFTDRYPGFDIDDPDWPVFSQQIEEVEKLLAVVKQRVPARGG